MPAVIVLTLTRPDITGFQTLLSAAESGHTQQTLVSLVVSPGNHELHSNVATAIVFLASSSAAFRRGLRDGAFVGALVDMLRPQSTRPFAVYVLQAVHALLQEPVDVLQALPPQSPPAAGLGGGTTDDITIVVRAPGARTGVKMSCPAVPLIQAASPLLGRLVLPGPDESLAVLEGSYELWEELMSHVAAPQTVQEVASKARLELLFELLQLTHTYEIPALHAQYSTELASRLDISTSPVILGESVRSHASWLATQAFRFMLRHLDQVLSGESASRSAKSWQACREGLQLFLSALLEDQDQDDGVNNSTGAGDDGGTGSGASVGVEITEGGRGGGSGGGRSRSRRR